VCECKVQPPTAAGVGDVDVVMSSCSVLAAQTSSRCPSLHMYQQESMNARLIVTLVWIPFLYLSLWWS
jgi:hypothetical protein